MYQFPFKTTYTEKEQKNNFWRFIFTYSPNPGLHYKITLPDYVKPIKLIVDKIKDFNLYTLGVYHTVKEAPLFEVQVIYKNIKNEINPIDWLKGMFMETGENIVTQRVLRRKTGDYIDCLTHTKIAGEVLLARYTVYKDFDMQNGGANYFMVKAGCLEEDYNTLSMDIFQTVTGFELVNQSNWQMAEQLKTESISIAEKQVSFYYPISWQTKKIRDQIREAIRIVLSHKTENKYQSTINLYFWKLRSGVTERTILQGMLERMKGIMNYHLPPLSRVEDYLNPNITELWFTTGELIGKEDNSEAELSITIGRLDNIWFYLEMAGPKEWQDYYYWSVNKRTRSLLLHSLNNPELVLQNSLINT